MEGPIKSLFVHLSACLPACLSVCLSVCLFLYLFVSLSICLSVSLSICLSVSLSVSVSVCLSVCLSLHLSVCPSVCHSVYLPFCLSICQISIFLGNDSLVFSDFWPYHRYLEYLSTGSGHFSRKIHFCPDLGKKSPKWPQSKFFWFFGKFCH